LTALLIFCAGAALLRAQNLPVIHFTVFALRPVANLVFVPRPNVAPQPVLFYPTARSPRYEYRGAMPLRFVDTKSNSIVAEASLPANIDDALLLFLPVEPAPAGGLRFRIAVLADDAARLAPGALAIVNLSGLALAGRVGDRDVTLAAGLNPA